MSIPSPFAAVDTDFNRTTEYALKLKSDAGYAVLTYGPNFPGPATTPTGLANDGTLYTATVTVNGTPHAVSIAGSAAQTFATLITEINADISTWATAALVGDTIVITVTNPVPGPTSTITVVDSGANHLFASVKGHYFGFVNNKSVKGADEYVLWDKLDSGTQYNVNYAVNTFLAAATANTNQPWTSGSDAISFPTLAPTRNTDTGLVLTTVYDLNVNVDGAGAVNLLINLPILETQATVSFNHLLDAINVALKAQSVAAIATYDQGTPLTLRITSNSVGTTSTVAITAGTSSDVLTALAAFGPANAPATTAGHQTVNVGGAKVGTDPTGLANDATAYTASISVDGTPHAISVVGSAAQTYTTLLAEINTDLGAAATATLSGGNILVTSATTGLLSSVAITDTTLFSTLTGYVAILAAVAGTDAAGVNGTTDVTFPVTKAAQVWADWGEVLAQWPSLTGTAYGPLFTSGNHAHIKKENKPAAKGDCTLTYVYWDGSAWKFYNNDVTVGSTVNPPTPA